MSEGKARIVLLLLATEGRETVGNVRIKTFFSELAHRLYPFCLGLFSFTV